jgi:hypothetical protein
VKVFDQAKQGGSRLASTYARPTARRRSSLASDGIEDQIADLERTVSYGSGGRMMSG